MELNYAAIPAIVVICYLIGLICKAGIPSEKIDKFIPIVVGVAGLVLGVVAFLFIPNILTVDNVYDAAAIGIVSGFTSTGVNQIYKQLKE